jgi:hypothetical protein
MRQSKKSIIISSVRVIVMLASLEQVHLEEYTSIKTWQTNHPLKMIVATMIKTMKTKKMGD